MKKSLLDVVQSILSTLDADPVSSIDDTNESQQVAEKVRDTYFEVIDEMRLPANHQLMALTGLSSASRPHVLRVPDAVSNVIFFKYNVADPGDKAEFKEIKWKKPEDFVNLLNTRDSLNTTDYFQWSTGGVKLTIGKKADPSFYTSFDDEHIVCDSYNSTHEATMQASKTQAYCEIRPVFNMEDDFVIDLPENMMGVLMQTAENRCFFLQKLERYIPGEKAEQRRRVRAQRNKFRQDREQNKFKDLPDYGRR